MDAKLRQEKIQTLTESEGFDDVEDLLEERGMDSCVPGICINPGCDATYDYEPDSERGWCDECQTNSVQSILILMGII